jgi:hypothetical protein
MTKKTYRFYLTNSSPNFFTEKARNCDLARLKLIKRLISKPPTGVEYLTFKTANELLAEGIEKKIDESHSSNLSFECIRYSQAIGTWKKGETGGWTIDELKAEGLWQPED